MEGRDVIGVANTGTGKSAAFVFPNMHQLLASANRGFLLPALDQSTLSPHKLVEVVIY